MPLLCLTVSARAKLRCRRRLGSFLSKPFICFATLSDIVRKKTMTIVSPAAMAKLAIDRASIVDSCKKNREIFIPNREIGRFSLFHQKSGDLPQNRETWKLWYSTMWSVEH